MRKLAYLAVAGLFVLTVVSTSVVAGPVIGGRTLYATSFDKAVVDLDNNDLPDNWTTRNGATAPTTPGWRIDPDGELIYDVSGTNLGMTDYTGTLTTGAAGNSLTDCVVTASFQQSGANMTGLVSRLVNAGSYYHARHYANSLQIYKFPASLLVSVPVPGPDRYQAGETWQISMTTFENRISAKLTDNDGKVVAKARVIDNAYSTGSAGFRCYGTSIYEDFSIRELHTQTITTAEGNGADTYVEYLNGANTNNNYGTATVINTKNAVQGTSELFRKGYLRFDLSQLAFPVEDAFLQLTTGNDSTGQTFSIFGLNDGHAGENWGETTITYANAPANTSVANSNNDITADAAFLGTLAGAATGVTTQFSSDDFVDFLLADTDGLVTLIVTRDWQDPNYGGSIHSFRSKEYGSGEYAPRLLCSVQVPEPTTLSLLGLGGLALIRRRRKA